jgi:four helix bundle protein
MNDFTEFDAFQRCRDFARAIAVPLNGGIFSRDPVLVTQLRRTVISVYSNFAEGFERDGNRKFAQFVSISMIWGRPTPNAKRTTLVNS